MNAGFTLHLGERMPLIMQAESAECGPACLAMILGYFGFVTDLVSVRRRFPTTTRGVTLYDIKRMAEEYGLKARAVKADWQQIQEFGYPAVAHWEGRHFVVVRSVRRGRVTVFDPARGIRRIKAEEFLGRAADVFLFLSPGVEFKRKTERTKCQLTDIVPFNHALLADFGQIMLASLLMEAVALLLPVFFQFGIDRIPVTGDSRLLGVVAVGFLFLTGFNFFVDVIRGKIIIFVKARLGLETDTSVYQKLLSLPQLYFDNRHPGDTLSRFNSLRAIQTTLSGSFVEAIMDGMLAVGTLALMAVYSLTLTGIVLALYCAYLLVRALWYQRVRDANEQQMIAQAHRETDLVESVHGAQTIKIFGKQTNRLERWARKVIISVNADAKVSWFLLMYKSSGQFIIGASNVLLIWVGILWVLKGELTIGMLVAFMAFSSQFVSKGSQLLDQIVTYVALQVHIRRVTDITAIESEPTPKHTVTNGDNLAARLELRAVSYRYAANLPYILKSFSLLVNEGECVAIKGPSGTGKSTLAKLILDLMAPQEGEIRLGGQLYEVLGVDRVRSLMGAVMQDDIVFEGSILDNIAFFDDDPDVNWVTECAELANIHSDIVAMPMGYETLMGNMGSALSGGQKQRILIARALYKRPKFLVLDEATSHLDPANEQAVGNALRSLPLTRVVFAHRETTLKLADRVVELAPDTRIHEFVAKNASVG